MKKMVANGNDWKLYHNEKLHFRVSKIFLVHYGNVKNVYIVFSTFLSFDYNTRHCEYSILGVRITLSLKLALKPVLYFNFRTRYKYQIFLIKLICKQTYDNCGKRSYKNASFLIVLKNDRNEKEQFNFLVRKIMPTNHRNLGIFKKRIYL